MELYPKPQDFETVRQILVARLGRPICGAVIPGRAQVCVCWLPPGHDGPHV